MLLLVPNQYNYTRQTTDPFSISFILRFTVDSGIIYNRTLRTEQRKEGKGGGKGRGEWKGRGREGKEEIKEGKEDEG